MKRNYDGWPLIVAAAGGIAIAIYYAFRFHRYLVVAPDWERSPVLIGLILFILLFTVMHLLVGLALAFGRVERVTGRRESAALFLGEHEIAGGQRVRWVWKTRVHLSEGETALTLFMAGWRPRACPTEQFLTPPQDG